MDEVDAQMSTWKPDSDLMRLNAAPLDTWVPLPDRLLTVLEAGLAISRQTGGAFEMNIGDAVRAWGFGPDTIDLRAIRAASAGAARSGQRGAGAGPGAMVAPANRPRWRWTCPASPRAMGWTALPKPRGILASPTHFAPSTARFGPSAPGGTGGPGRSAIETPDDSSHRLNIPLLALEDMAVATSGDYRHFVTVGTTRLSHTMDPRRGAPLVAAPASVTVLSQSCMMADAMATALMVMGERGVDFAKDHAISALFLRRSKMER